MMDAFVAFSPTPLYPSAWYLFPCSAFRHYHLPSLHLVLFFWRIAMENVVPQMMSLFSHNLLVVFFPSTPHHSGLISYVGLRCVPRRERKERKTVYFPAPQHFYSSNPLKKWQKKKFQSNTQDFLSIVE
jgi:hypothetical protein